MITAQNLHDRREELGEIDGKELHELFQAVIGEPSPAGRTPIQAAALTSYAAQCRATLSAHKVNDGRGGEYLEAVARFCEAFTL